MIFILIRCVFLSLVRCLNLQVFLDLYRVNRERSVIKGFLQKVEKGKEKVRYKFLINYYIGLFTN